jgi:hypothetical protein
VCDCFFPAALKMKLQIHVRLRWIKGTSVPPAGSFHSSNQGERFMTRLKLLGATTLFLAAIASPVLAQDSAMGPGYRGSIYYNQGYQHQRGGYWRDDGYRDNGFAPLDAAEGVVDGAIDAAGAIATAPFRAMEGGSYARMQGDVSYCAQRFRSYDPESGTFMGYDGRRHPCQ